MKDGKFQYRYEAPTEEERREILSIRSNYLAEEKNVGKLERLRLLDRKVRSSATAASIGLGVVGCLIFGLGMALTLEWELFAAGIATSAAGCIPIAAAYSVYRLVLEKNKKKYGAEILKLSDELLHGNADEA